MRGLSTLSKQIAKHGRYGDDEILHVNKAEIAGLDNLARQIYGHPLTRNPATGQKEAFLFLPFLAPMLASAGVLGAGMTGLGALGTGLLAGGAGALEASARGMDDPLKQGLMAGLTAGAGSALTSGIMGAAGQPGIDATANSLAANMGGTPVPGPDIGAAATQGFGGADNAAALLNEQYLSSAAVPGDALPAQFTGSTNMAPDIARAYGIAPPPAATLAAPAPDVAPTMQPATMPSAFDRAKTGMTQFGQGLKSLATDDKALGTFLSAPATKGAAIAGATGLAGMSQLDYEAKSKADAEAREDEKQQKYDALKNQIKQRYADAGRTGWWDQPGVLPGVNFADGGSVTLSARKNDGYDNVRDSIADNYVGAGREIPPWLQGYGKDAQENQLGTLARFGPVGIIAGLMANPRAMTNEAALRSMFGGSPNGQSNYAQGGQVFPMRAGGFVVPKYAVDAVGGGNNDRGLVALKRKIGAEPIRGKGTGTSDSIPAKIDGKIPAKVSNGEAYIPPKGVKKAGGSKQLYALLDAAKRNRKGV